MSLTKVHSERQTQYRSPPSGPAGELQVGGWERKWSLSARGGCSASYSVGLLGRRAARACDYVRHTHTHVQHRITADFALNVKMGILYLYNVKAFTLLK